MYSAPWGPSSRSRGSPKTAWFFASIIAPRSRFCSEGVWPSPARAFPVPRSIARRPVPWTRWSWRRSAGFIQLTAWCTRLIRVWVRLCLTLVSRIARESEYMVIRRILWSNSTSIISGWSSSCCCKYATLGFWIFVFGSSEFFPSRLLSIVFHWRWVISVIKKIPEFLISNGAQN